MACLPGIPRGRINAEQTSASHESSPRAHHELLIPPREFQAITPQIWMSALPHRRSLPFLQQRSTASILFLTPKHPLKYELADDLRSLFLSCKHLWLAVEKTKAQGKVVATQAIVQAGLEVC